MLSKYFQHFLDENDLKIGEEFYIVDKNGQEVYYREPFYFEENNILRSSLDHGEVLSPMLLNLFDETHFVKKLYWPEKDDPCYYVSIEGKINKIYFDPLNTFDCMLRKEGKLYKKPEEASRYFDRDYEDLIEKD